MAKTKQLYEDNGVELSKATISIGDEVTLSYSGLLARNGADAVYAHIGYGDDWAGKEFIPMEKKAEKFKATFKVTLPDKLNIAFKDGIDNWDNNSQQNYSFEVSAKKAVKATSASKEKKTTPKVKATAVKADTAKEGKETKPKATKASSTTAKSTSAKTAPSKATATKAVAKTSAAEKTPAAKKSSASKSVAAKKTSK